jgi:Tol biopolymer transport system component
MTGSAYRVSVLGGTPRRIADGILSVTASPDGKLLALTTGTIGERVDLRIAGSDGDGPRDLTGRKGADHFDSSAAWAPDGRSLAIVSHAFGEAQQIVLIDPESGQERPLDVPSLRSFSDLTWMPGTSALIVAGSELPVVQQGSWQIWSVPVGGEPEPLTRDLNSYTDVSMTADGATIAAVQVEVRSGIDLAPIQNGAVGPFKELFPISPSRAGLTGLAWLAPDQLAHTQLQAEREQIHVTNVATGTSRALTSGDPHGQPRVSRDGRTLIVARSEGDHSRLWQLDPATGREQRLTGGKLDTGQVVAPDGSYVVYTAMAKTVQLIKMPVGGGTPVELMNRPSFCLDVSPDGRDLVCLRLSPSGQPETILLAAAGGEPRPIPGLPAGAHAVKFGQDGRSLVYLVSHEGADELWRFPLAQGTPSRMARLEGQSIEDFALSPDGSRLAIVKVSRSGDVVLLKRPAS